MVENLDIKCNFFANNGNDAVNELLEQLGI